ncbi:hypothetical protein K491DRAFT_765654 [Lophiostoma macrostomum CBS 122681]|uniref:C2H2-type domain-containing protein n=1 Tax=Lophiostoma macrostomum CBS 122681 TaxID=1314788 RepID=A0A6A6TMQ8_9PLEO|nr:hypothetical protein K491DRAFT_765654 [Lophiostoma macrostomum CBS 122681]
MADSDYDFEEDGSDDEYIASRATSSTRAQAPTKRKIQEKTRQPHAWESQSARRSPEYIVPVAEADDGTIQQSVKEREEERKRKRLRKDTKPFQRGIIRHVVLVLDLSEAMLDKDMRPNRYHTMIKYTQEYVREFFEQNPISQMSVLGMHDGLCILVKSNSISYAQPWHARGHRRLRFAIVTRSGRHTPDDQSLCARPHPFRTNAGDESEYVVATDQELLRELLLATTTPPVVRSDRKTPAPAQESAAALMMMGFPSRVVEDVPTMCACHGILTTGGYTCSRCKAKVCSLPITCPSCQLTLLLSTHLARSYHHLFPLRNWAEVSWVRAEEKGTRECLGCQAPFPEPPTNNRHSRTDESGESNGKVDGAVGQRQVDVEESEEQKASESSRYECRSCESHFCIDCDMFCHMVLHNCPGCLSQQWLIRFVADDGKTYYGNLEKETETREIEGQTVEALDGDFGNGFQKTGKKVTVSKLLSPIGQTKPVLCIGLNYRQHAEEANLQVPAYPTVFVKPPDAIAGPLDDVPIHKDCQSQLDYEGELTVIIGKDAKNVSASDALSYVAGYTVGNDVSARNFQLPASVSGGQFGYAKSFDKFAPIGPVIVSSKLIPDPQKLHYWTKVNGEKRQETGTDDMIFTVAQIVEHLSRGTTLRAGTAIMTGTPSGVGLFREPKAFVKDGDEVEIYVEGIGSLVNKMKFE